MLSNLSIDTNPKNRKFLDQRFSAEVTTLESLGFHCHGVYADLQPRGLLSPATFLLTLFNRECLSYAFPFGYRLSNLLFIHPEKSIIAYIFGLGIVMYTTFDDETIHGTANFGGFVLNVNDPERKFKKLRVPFLIPDAFYYHCQTVDRLEQEGKNRNTSLTFESYFSISLIDDAAMENATLPKCVLCPTIADEAIKTMPRYHPMHRPFQPPEDWSFTVIRSDTPAVNRINDGLRLLSGHPEFPHSATVQALIETPTESGMHSDEEGFTLAEIEDQITNEFIKDNIAIPFLVSTQNSRKKWHFYISDTDLITKRFEAVRAKVTTHQLSLSIENDPSWQEFENFFCRKESEEAPPVEP